MDPKTFAEFRELIYSESGIALGKDKAPLLLNRISRRLRKLQLDSPEAYLTVVRSESAGEELKLLLEAISTNTTHFFREKHHFTIFQERLKALAASGAQQVRVWCAASSSGEEPYTLAMVGTEALAGTRTELKILATDLNVEVLRQAVEGIYDPQQLREAPESYIQRYFTKQRGARGHEFHVAPKLKELIVYKKLNLTHQPYPMRGPFDVIFCRNVMIYFDRPVRQKIIKEFERLLPPGGLLVLSHSENLLGIDHALDSNGQSTYLKR